MTDDPSDPPPRHPLPPFTADSAPAKVHAAEDAWNTRDPSRMAAVYTSDSVWRNRSAFFTGRTAIEAFLTDKWATELDYARKELWAFGDDRIAVRFQHEWHDVDGRWWRSYGSEQWEFDALGYMRRREASTNDVPLAEADRRIHGPWPASDRTALPLQ